MFLLPVDPENLANFTRVPVILVTLKITSCNIKNDLVCSKILLVSGMDRLQQGGGAETNLGGGENCASAPVIVCFSGLERS